MTPPRDANDELREKGLDSVRERQDRAQRYAPRDRNDDLREKGPESVRQRIDRAERYEPPQADNNKDKGADAVMVCAADVVVREKNWLWPGHLLRGALELTTGLPGIGKTHEQCSLVGCATKPRRWPDGAQALVFPVNVIMVTAEDSLDQEVVPRLIAAGADLSRVHILKCIKTDRDQRQLLISEDLDKIERAMARIGNVGLITIDPITAYMGGKMDSHKVTEVRSQLGPLKDFAERVDAAVSAITHPAKNPGKRAIDHFIASQAFIAAARIGHACFEEMVEDKATGETKPTGRVLFTTPKHNPSAPVPTLAFRIIGGVPVGQDKKTGNMITSSRVVWEDKAVSISADEAAAAAEGGGNKKNDPQAEVRKFLAELLVDGKPIAVKQIVKEGADFGFSKKQIIKAGNRLSVVKEKSGYDGGWVWTLPPAPF
jgi:putative DNA primase/helicase